MNEQIEKLENINGIIGEIDDILQILCTVLDSEECSGYAKQYSSVTAGAIRTIRVVDGEVRDVLHSLYASRREAIA